MSQYLKVPSDVNGTAFRRSLMFVGEYYGNMKRVRGKDKAFKAGCRYIAKKIGHSTTSVRCMACQKWGKLYYHKVAYVKAYSCLLRCLMLQDYFSNPEAKQKARNLMTELKKDHAASVSDGIAYYEKNGLKIWARGERDNWHFPIVQTILREYDIGDKTYAEKWRRL